MCNHLFLLFAHICSVLTFRSAYKLEPLLLVTKSMILMLDFYWLMIPFDVMTNDLFAVFVVYRDDQRVSPQSSA